jgi:hypothetical protein
MRVDWMTRAGLAVWLLVLAGASGLAPGRQFQLPADFGDLFVPEIARTDAAWIARDLNLDSGQRATLESLIRDYEVAFSTASDQARTRLARAMPGGDIDQSVRTEREEELRAKMEDLLDQASQIPADAPKEEREAQRARIRARIDEVRKQLQDMNPPPLQGDQLKQAIVRAASDLDLWRQERAGLRAHFVDDFQVMLSEAQRELWPAADRKLFRRQMITRGRLSGESLDLFRILDELKLPEQTQRAIQPALAQYDVQLDAALTSRARELAKAQRDLLTMVGSTDLQRTEEIIDRQIKARVAVRDVNDESAAAIAAAMPKEEGERFTDTVRARGYPRVYRSTQTQRLLKAALELPDLDARQREAVQSLETNYATELKPINDRLWSVVRSGEPQEMKSRLMKQAAAADGVTPEPVPVHASVSGASNNPANPEVKPSAKPGPETPAPMSDPIAEAFRKRYEQESRFLDQLKSILTAEQSQRLPWGTGSTKPPETAGK